MPPEFLGDPSASSPWTWYLLGARRSFGEGEPMWERHPRLWAVVELPCGRDLAIHPRGTQQTKNYTQIHPSFLRIHTRWIFPVNLNITRWIHPCQENSRERGKNTERIIRPGSILIFRRSKQTGHNTRPTADPRTDIWLLFDRKALSGAGTSTMRYATRADC